MTPSPIDHLIETHGEDAARRVLEEAHAQHTDLGLDHRAIFTARLVHELQRETHVVVGDHTPEPRRLCDDPARKHGYPTVYRGPEPGHYGEAWGIDD